MRGARGDAIEGGAQPTDAAIDGGRLGAGQIAHWPRIALRPRYGIGDPPAGRAAAIGGVVYISAFAVDEGIDQCVNRKAGQVGK